MRKVLSSLIGKKTAISPYMVGIDWECSQCNVNPSLAKVHALQALGHGISRLGAFVPFSRDPRGN